MSLLSKLNPFTKPNIGMRRPVASEVVGRAFALNSALGYSTLLWTMGEDRDVAGSLSGILVQEAKTAGFFPHYSNAENNLFAQPLSTVKEQQLRDMAWKIEALQVLLWGAEYIVKLPDLTSEAQPNIASRLKPGCFAQQSRTFKLRPVEQIEACRLEALLWFWRCGISDCERNNDSIPSIRLSNYKCPVTSYRGLLEYVTKAGSASGLLREVMEGDFAIRGIPFRDLCAEEKSQIASITRERVFALNWLCGLAPRIRWDESPSDLAGSCQTGSQTKGAAVVDMAWWTEEVRQCAWPDNSFIHKGTPLHIKSRLDDLERALMQGKERVRDVAGRAYALKGLVFHFKGLMILVKGEAVMGATLLDDLVANLVPEFIKISKIQGIWEYFSDWERLLLEKKYSQLSGDEICSAVGRGEALVALLFALGVLPQLPPFDCLAKESYLKLLPPSFESFLASASLRNREELEFARAAAEMWHLRCETRLAVEEQKPVVAELRVPGNPMEQVVKIMTETAVKRGYVQRPINGDFPARDKAFHDLSEAEAWEVGLIARERLRAFNWLCGRAPGNRWDESPLST